MKLKEESEKSGLNVNIQKTKIMASSPITSWKIDGETVETMTSFSFLGSKITVDSDCSHEIKRHFNIQDIFTLVIPTDTLNSPGRADIISLWLRTVFLKCECAQGSTRDLLNYSP